MESYNYQEQQTQYTSPNYYGFTYNNYYTQQPPHYNQADSSYLYNNACYNSYSTNSTSPSSLSYSSNNSLYNSTNISQQDIYEPIQACSVSSLNNQTSEFSSPKSYSYSNQTQYTPSISHYQPTTYSSTYTSTPFTSHLNKIDAIECVQPKVKKIKEKSSKSTGPHKRPKVIKLDISKTNIGFGNVVQTALPSDFNTTANNVHKSFNCTECNASFSIAAKLFMHQHKQHKNRSSTECPICDKKFNSPANALVHLRAHTQEKTYKCEECHLAFCDSSTLKKHIRTHTGEKPYECTLCPKKFAQSGNLKRHLAVHEKYDALQGLAPISVEHSLSEDSNIEPVTTQYQPIIQQGYAFQQSTTNDQYKTNYYSQQSYNYY